MMNELITKGRRNKMCMLAIGVVALIVMSASPATVLAEGTTRYGVVSQAATMSVHDQSFAYSSYTDIHNVSMPMGAPGYSDMSYLLTNECGSVAGANIIGFYDHSVPDLIPNFTSTIPRGSKHIFKGVTAETQGVINSLYGLMSTNQSAPGATMAQIKNGLNSYVASKGKTITYDSAMDGNIINVSRLRQSLSNNKPVLIFTSTIYVITSLTINSTNAVIQTIPFVSNHVAVVTGYREVMYYVGQTTAQWATYLEVSLGIRGQGKGYLLLASLERVEDMTAITIS